MPFTVREELIIRGDPIPYLLLWNWYFHHHSENFDVSLSFPWWSGRSDQQAEAASSVAASTFQRPAVPPPPGSEHHCARELTLDFFYNSIPWINLEYVNWFIGRFKIISLRRAENIRLAVFRSMVLTQFQGGQAVSCQPPIILATQCHFLPASHRWVRNLFERLPICPCISKGEKVCR